MEGKEVVVERFENEVDAEIARGHLIAEGIEAAIVKDDAGGMFPSLQLTDGVQLVVPEHSAAVAKAVLNRGLPSAMVIFTKRQ